MLADCCSSRLDDGCALDPRPPTCLFQLLTHTTVLALNCLILMSIDQWEAKEMSDSVLVIGLKSRLMAPSLVIGVSTLWELFVLSFSPRHFRYVFQSSVSPVLFARLQPVLEADIQVGLAPVTCPPFPPVSCFSYLIPVTCYSEPTPCLLLSACDLSSICLVSLSAILFSIRCGC